MVSVLAKCMAFVLAEQCVGHLLLNLFPLVFHFPNFLHNFPSLFAINFRAFFHAHQAVGPGLSCLVNGSAHLLDHVSPMSLHKFKSNSSPAALVTSDMVIIFKCERT